MSFQRQDIVDGRAMGAGNAKADGRNGNRGGFRTDSSISNSRQGGERPLQRWVPDANPQDIDSSLEKSSASGGQWDQFAENERRFGIKTTYDENFYTTPINKSHPQYAQRKAAAEKAAREIERTAPTTSHVAEERVMDFAGGNDKGGDEEDKYSGVRRQDSTLQSNRDNKYTPPARRAPTGQATVLGAPVDPAIISSQIKGPPSKKQTAGKTEESKPQAAVSDAPPSVTPKAENKVSETKSESKPAAKTAGNASETASAETKSVDPKSSDKAMRPSASTSRNLSPQGKETGTTNAAGASATNNAANASATVEKDVLKHFKDFASKQRVQADKMRSNKLKADTQVKLQELKKFADNFKLTTPVPSDLISIIAKDPDKRKRIQEKALQNVDDQRVKGAAAKDKDVGAADSVPKAPVEQPTGPSPIPTGTDSRTNARANAPQHTPSPSGVANRHPNQRQPYTQYNQQQFRNDRSGPQHTQGRGGEIGRLADRIQQNREQNKFNRHAPQHQPQFHPPTGPANNMDPNYGRRPSGNPIPQVKLNPNSHEFRPTHFAGAFNPTGPSTSGSSPRSAVNQVERPASSPQVGQLIQRKSKSIDVKKCMILSNIKAFVPSQGRNFDDNHGLRPSYDTMPTWRQPLEEEKPDSTMHMTYKEYFERMPFAAASMATPNPPHALPQQLAHQHQLPFHLQHGAHAVPRQSPHMSSMQMHGSQHGHVPQVSFNSTDDHRMMHSNSAQSYASPRMAQMPMYPQQMNAPAQMPYNQPGVAQFMPSTPQMNQYRTFSSSPQYMPQQTPPMGMPMMGQPFVAPHNNMMPSGPQMPVYPGGHPQYMPPAGVTPQQMQGSNGFPSPVRPAAAPMMVQQGSQQGQPMYGMSPNMHFQQPMFVPQQSGQPMNMRGYSNPGPQQFGTSPQQMHHQYGGPQQHRNGSNNFNKNFQGHNQHQGPQPTHAIPAGGPGRVPDGLDEAK